jgi:hypothetical protein
MRDRRLWRDVDLAARSLDLPLDQKLGFKDLFIRPQIRHQPLAEVGKVRGGRDGNLTARMWGHPVSILCHKDGAAQVSRCCRIGEGVIDGGDLRIFERLKDCCSPLRLGVAVILQKRNDRRTRVAHDFALSLAIITELRPVKV